MARAAPGGSERSEGAATGPDADRARRAALEASGEVYSVEPDDRGWSVDVLKSDYEISVELNSEFEVTETETERISR